MSKTLLLISLGPVQSMIAQAKRTRDLWMGSFLISEISKAAAKALADDGAVLVFPALCKGDEDLEPCYDPLKPNKLPVFNVANKIVAVVEGDGKRLAKNAREASKKRLVKWGLRVWCKEKDLVDPKSKDSAEEQLESFLEFQAVWAPFEESAYAHVRNQLEAELQARKSLRIFKPWSKQREGIYKSSLDGVRESVLKKPDERDEDKNAWQTYRIGKREELDAIGLLKRAGGNPQQFVPVPTIGLAPWIERAAKTCPMQIAKLKDLCANLPFTNVKREAEWVNRFPFDGQIFLEDRLQPYCEEHGIKSDESNQLRQLTKSIRNKLGDPHPFIACLVADGDKMGDRINTLAQKGYQNHQDFSRQLAGFAATAREIVEKDHRGILVYSGGDDVLALLNLEDALKCAFELQNAFKLRIGGDVTLSVGLGIGGVIESLGDLFEFGRQAEKEAKKDRNALAILIQKRGGSQRLWSCSWNDKPTALIEKDKDLLRKGYLSTKKIYQAGDMLRKMPKPEDEEGAAQWKDVLYLEWLRILSRNEGKDLPFEEFGLQKQGNYKTQYKTIERWISRLEIAHILQQAEPRPDLNTQEEAK